MMSFLSDVHVTCSEILTDHAITRFMFDFVGTNILKKKKRRFCYAPSEELEGRKIHLPKSTTLYRKSMTEVSSSSDKIYKSQKSRSITLDNFQEVTEQKHRIIESLNNDTTNKSDSVTCDNENICCIEDNKETKSEKSPTLLGASEGFAEIGHRKDVLNPCENDCYTQSVENILENDPGGSGDTRKTNKLEGALKTNEAVRPVQDDDKNNTDIEYDSDGDLKVKRKADLSDSGDDTDSFCITIKHSLATELDAVGEQVWQGALLLCDYILYQRSEFQGRCVVDLGAGTGLTSIVCAMFAKHVYCTDTGDNVLKLAQSNVDSAKYYFSYQQPLCPIDVKDLNWFTNLSELPLSQASPSVFLLSRRDLESIKHTELLVAADVIYDNDITDAFFSTIKYLMAYPPGKTLYIALERRLVFTIEDLDVSSPGYNHFRSHLNRLAQTPAVSDSNVTFTVEQIETDFPQFFQYNRTIYLELWKVSSTYALDKT